MAINLDLIDQLLKDYKKTEDVLNQKLRDWHTQSEESADKQGLYSMSTVPIFCILV